MCTFVETNGMLQKFQQFIKKENLFAVSDKILLAVSGGIDSVVLCELFSQAGLSFAIAHCNFQLRGEESGKDAEFVKSLSEKYGVEFYETVFETKKYVETHKVSIQMAARDLRYNWFKEVSESHNFQYIATGHHFDDNIETLLLNLTRGTGIRGLRGILPKSNKIIRPILWASRNEIADFCEKNDLTFREDASNKETKYKRNKIRHELIPLLEQLNPNVKEVFQREIGRFKQLEILLDTNLQKVKEAVVSSKNDVISIDLELLKTFHPTPLFLYEILSEYGFTESETENILEEHHTFSGKQFFSSTHRIVLNRNHLLISKKVETNLSEEIFEVPESADFIEKPLRLRFSIIRKESDFQIFLSKNIALLDYHLLQFPLSIRKWQHGDFFFPMGMRGKKKISDFFASNHFSALDKENTFLLFSGNNLVWVMGHRIDNCFKITNKTQKILKIEIVG